MLTDDPPTEPSRDPALIAHIEKHLGRIDRGSRFSGDSELQVAIIDGEPRPAAQAYVTLGLSNHVLRSVSARQFRMELLGASYRNFNDLRPEANLLTIALDVLASHEALLRGHVVTRKGPIVAGSRLDAYYCATPVYFRDGLSTFRGSVPATVIVWLVPISHAEAQYVWQHGWSKFEDLLVARDPDLLDLHRASLL
ncbi:MAG: suppressor of fused domain protein [Gemmatimonadaceae bacterium]